MKCTYQYKDQNLSGATEAGGRERQAASALAGIATMDIPIVLTYCHYYISIIIIPMF